MKIKSLVVGFVLLLCAAQAQAYPQGHHMPSGVWAGPIMSASYISAATGNIGLTTLPSGVEFGVDGDFLFGDYDSAGYKAGRMGYGVYAGSGGSYVGFDAYWTGSGSAWDTFDSYSGAVLFHTPNTTHTNTIFRMGFVDRTTNNLSTTMIWNQEGTVGIGTVDLESWGTGYEALQIGSKSAIMSSTDTGATNVGLYILQNAYFDGAYKYKSTDSASGYRQMEGAHQFWTAASGTADTALSWTTVAEFTAAGKAVFATEGSGAGLQLGNDVSMYDGGTNTLIIPDIVQIGAGMTTGLVLAGNDNTNHLVFAPGGTSEYLMYVNSDALIWYSSILGGANIAQLNSTGEFYSSLGIRIGAQSTNNEIDDSASGSGTTTFYIGNAAITTAFTGKHYYLLSPNLRAYLQSNGITLKQLNGAALILDGSQMLDLASVEGDKRFAGVFEGVTDWKDSLGRVTIVNATERIFDGTKTTEVRVEVPRKEAFVFVDEIVTATMVVDTTEVVRLINNIPVYATEVVNSTEIVRWETEYTEEGIASQVPVYATAMVRVKRLKEGVNFNKKRGVFWKYEEVPQYKEVLLDTPMRASNPSLPARVQDFTYSVARHGDSYENDTLRGAWVRSPVSVGDFLMVSDVPGWLEKWDGADPEAVVGRCMEDVSSNNKNTYIYFN